MSHPFPAQAATRACGNPGLRVPPAVELRGLDVAKHGGPAIRLFAADVAAVADATRRAAGEDAPPAAELASLSGDDARAARV